MKISNLYSLLLVALVGCNGTGGGCGTDTATTVPAIDPKTITDLQNKVTALEGTKADLQKLVEEQKAFIAAQKVEQDAKIAALKAPPAVAGADVDAALTTRNVETLHWMNPRNSTGKGEDEVVILRAPSKTVEAMVNSANPKREIYIMPSAPMYPLETLPPPPPPTAAPAAGGVPPVPPVAPMPPMAPVNPNPMAAQAPGIGWSR